MAFSREFIREQAKEFEIELPKGFIDAIANEYLTAKKAYADEQIEKAVKPLNDQIADITEKLKNAETQNGENAKYKEQYETTKAEYEKFKTDTETKAAKAAANATFTKWLRENGYTEKGAAKIVKYGGFTPEFNKDGTIKNADKLSESVSAEWSEYKAKEHVEGAKTETPPANTGGNTITREDILKIPNTAERQKAIAENGALFGIK